MNQHCYITIIMPIMPGMKPLQAVTTFIDIPQPEEGLPLHILPAGS